MTTNQHTGNDKPTDTDASTDAETWKAIPGYSNYEASDLGRIRRITPGQGTYVNRILKLYPDKDGYLRCDLYQKGRRTNEAVAKLVMLTFVGERPAIWHQIDHKNAVRDDDRLVNLEYVTPAENMKRAYQRKLALIKSGPPARRSVRKTNIPARPSKTARQAPRGTDTKGLKSPAFTPFLCGNRVWRKAM
jgi:hypothetical protein